AGDDLDDLVYHLLDESRIVGLGHDTNQRLGARRADDEAAGLAKPCARIFDRRLDQLALERRAAGEADVLEQLRHRLELAADLAGRLTSALDAGKHLQRRDEAIAGGGEVGEDNVARLLTANVEAVGAHVLDHIAVTDLGAVERKTEALEITLEAEVGHDGRDRKRVV